MKREGDETHIPTNEARGGDTYGIVRWVLLGGLLLAIVALTAIWVTGAATSDQPNSDIVSGQATPRA